MVIPEPNNIFSLFLFLSVISQSPHPKYWPDNSRMMRVTSDGYLWH